MLDYMKFRFAIVWKKLIKRFRKREKLGECNFATFVNTLLQ